MNVPTTYFPNPPHLSNQRTQRLLEQPAAWTLAICLCVAAMPAFADGDSDGEENFTWGLAGELSLVATDGNAEASTLGLGLLADRKTADGGHFEFALAGLRTETTTKSRRAVGTVDDFALIEESQTDLTAENYELRGRYDKELGERTFWFVAGSWSRNEFAGFDSRVSLALGYGHRWFDNEQGHFHTDYSVTYTQQDDLIENPALNDGFAGIRLGWNYRRVVSSSAEFTSLLAIDANADETEDLRVDFANALAVNINERLALKVGLKLLFDNLPALVQVPLETSSGGATGDSVFAELDDLDSVFTIALVMKR